MNAPTEKRDPVSEAVQWVSQITAISLEVLVCIWLGRWLDGRFGTAFWTPSGLVIGAVLGFWHLLTLTGVVGRKDSGENKRNGPPT